MKKIGRFGFFALTASMVTTIYSYPAFASSGFTLIFFVLVGGLFFFLPSAFVSAELATAQKWGNGGVYSWCSYAFGKRWGFFAVFMQWFQITIGLVVMLYFVVGSLSYLLGMSEINKDPLIKFLIVTGLFWLITFYNLKGTFFTSTMSRFGFLGGVIVPIIVLLLLASSLLISDIPKNINFFGGSFFPDFSNINTLVILVSFMLAYVGIEASAVHIPKMEDPKRDYPFAVNFLVFFDIAIKIIGASAIVLVIPASQIEMNAGLMQAYESYFTLFDLHLTYIVEIMAFLLIFGAIAEIGAWIVGPIRGMSYAANDGIIPASLAKMNKNSVPEKLIIIQGIIVTFWAALITFSSSTSNVAFLIAISVTVVTYLMMYVVLFLAYYKLWAAYPEEKRAFIIPGGKIIRFIVPMLGLCMTLIAIGISFFPPSQIMEQNRGEYEVILAGSFIVIFLMPHIIYFLSKRT